MEKNVDKNQRFLILWVTICLLKVLEYPMKKTAKIHAYLSYTVQIYIVGRGGQHDTLANNMININMIAINMVYTEHAILV